MIEVTRLNGKKMIVNGDHVEKIDSTPDTIISLISGRKLLVSESLDEVLEKLFAWRQLSNTPSFMRFDEEIRQEIMDEALV
ncbi:MAG: flagellar FlbD family protein [Calditrichaeota bacterium]|nr:flagellar FlbD family protein [Calditrichota bacterium]